MERESGNMFSSEGITKSDRILHTPEAFAKKHLLYVQEAGVLESLTPHVCRREKLGSYLIFEVLDGKGSIVIEGQKTELQTGECVWVDCRNAYEHMSSSEKPWKLAWVHFNGVGAADFYELFRENYNVPVFTPADAAKVSKLIMAILNGLKQNISEFEIHSLLTQIMVCCVTKSREKGTMEEVREYINQNFRTRDLKNTLTERFHMSWEDLVQCFGESYGINIQDYILNRRFNAAKEMLRFTIRPVEEVIGESGVGDREKFYGLFQEYEGMTPEDYRKRWAQWIKD